MKQKHELGNNLLVKWQGDFPYIKMKGYQASPMSDSLFNSAEFHKNHLLNKSFYLRAGNKKHELVEFNIIFKEEHFKHLIGINKLNDFTL